MVCTVVIVVVVEVDPRTLATMTMFVMEDLQFQAVFNTLSFSLASMGATTMFLWFRSFAVKDRCQSAVIISGLVTFIACYHYMRIFNSWVEGYKYGPGPVVNGSMAIARPEMTGIPFNDAYRYMDWLLTVPLLLLEILLVMRIPPAELSTKAWTLRWGCWFLSMVFFLYIVYELMVGLSAATDAEGDEFVKAKIKDAQLMTVIS